MAPQLLERTWFRGGIAALLISSALSGIILMQSRQLQQSSGLSLDPQQQEQQEDLYIRSLKSLPTQGFGFNNVIADWAFLRFLQYFGDADARQETGYGVSPTFFEVISQRDPRFVETYVFGAGTLSYELGMPEASIRILDRGIANLDPTRHAGAHTLWTLKAMDQLLLLGDAPAAAESYQMAAQWAEQAPEPELRQDAPVLQRLSDFLQTDPDSTIVRFWAWTMVYEQAKATSNAKTQARARDELRLLGATEVETAEGQMVFRPPTPKPSPSTQPMPSPQSTTSESPPVAAESPATKGEVADETADQPPIADSPTDIPTP